MTATAADLVLRDTQVGLRGPRRDVVISDAAVVAVVPPGSDVTTAEAFDCAGATVLRGLWDRHAHLRHWALRRRSVDLCGARTVAGALDLLGAATGADVVFGFGAPEPLVRALADAGVDAGAVPMLVQSLDLHTAWVNDAAGGRAARARGGLLREQDCFAVASRLSAQADVTADLRAALHDAAARGVVGVLDFEMADNVTLWPQLAATGELPVRIECSIPRDRLDAAIEAGLRTGDVLDGRGRIRVGPVKTFVDGALGSATALCSSPYPGTAGDHHQQGHHQQGHGRRDHGRQELDPVTLTDLIVRAGAHGITAAVHAIGDRANEIALDAFAAAGLGGRIEHAQLVRPADIARFAQLGVVAGVQPAHLIDDRDLADELWAGQSGLGYAYASLRAAGAAVEFGSDAPVSPLDPWLAVRAAVSRTGDARPAWHPEEAMTVSAALDASTGGRATPRAGDVADLVIVEGLDGLDDHVKRERSSGRKRFGDGRGVDGAAESAHPAQIPVVRVLATLLGGWWTHGH